MNDLVRVIEAAYSLAERDEGAWLARLAETMRVELGFAHGLVAHAYRVTRGGSVVPTAVTSPKVGPALATALLDSARTTLVPAGVSLLTRIDDGPRVPSLARRAHYARVLGARGFVDALALHATDSPRHGCTFLVPLSRAGALTARTTARYTGLCTHIAVGLRLRRALEQTAAPSFEAHGPIPRPNAGPKSARDTLRLAARAVDRARGKLRSSDPEEGRAILSGLVSGRWSLVDRFDADGRNYVVVRPNDPDAPDPRALTTRESQVAGFVALGRSNKSIGYDLGISPSTVGVLVARAVKKLGVRSRTHLATLFPPRRHT